MVGLRSKKSGGDAATPAAALRKAVARRPERTFEVGLVVGALVVVFVVLVIAQNGERARFDILWWNWTTRLWAALGASALVGLTVGLSIPAVLRRRRALKREGQLARSAIRDAGGSS
jgi:uncharacterized integral membrane protein